MNIVAPATVAVNAPAFVVAPTSAELFRKGFDAYCNSNCVATDLATTEERRGWWAALSAEAEAATPGYAQKMGW